MPWFKILEGVHTESKVTDPATGRPKQLIHRKGDIFKSAYDLDKIHNKGPGFNKFERMPEGWAPKRDSEIEVEDEFTHMTVDELKRFAADEEIDLEGSTRKGAIIETIRSALALKGIG